VPQAKEKKKKEKNHSYIREKCLVENSIKNTANRTKGGGDKKKRPAGRGVEGSKAAGRNGRQLKRNVQKSDRIFQRKGKRHD